MLKIMLLSDHSVRVMLAAILPLNPRYRLSKTQHLNIFVSLLQKATKNNYNVRSMLIQVLSFVALKY